MDLWNANLPPTSVSNAPDGSGTFTVTIVFPPCPANTAHSVNDDAVLALPVLNMPAQPAAVVSPPAPLNNVEHNHYAGGGQIAARITDACTASGLPLTIGWMHGYTTLCTRESSLNPSNAINTSDSNAQGPLVGDGHPQNCSRGLAQCIPSTFTRFHIEGTSWSIYDPVANISASMRYVRDRAWRVVGWFRSSRKSAAGRPGADSPRGY